MAMSRRGDLQDVRNDINYHEVGDQGGEVRGDVDIDTGTTSSTCSWECTIRSLRNHRGILWAIASACVSTAMSISIKLLAGEVAATQLMFFRGLAQVLFSSPHLVFFKVALRFSPKTMILIMSRALIGSLSGLLNYYSFQVLPVATAKALLYSSPLFTGTFARIFLKERCSVGIVLFASLTVVSVTLVVQPPFIFGGDTAGNFIGILCAIIGAVIMAVNTIILRFTQMIRVDAHAIIFIYGFIAMFCTGIVTTALGDWTNPPCGADRWFVIGVAVTGFLEQVTVTTALQTESAVVVSIIRTNDIFIAFVFDFLIFDIQPNLWTVVGAILVVGSAAGMTISAKHDKEKLLKEEYSTSSGLDD